MKRASSDDRIPSARAGDHDRDQDNQDWAPPVAPMAMPRQSLETPRVRPEWQPVKGPSPQGN